MLTVTMSYAQDKAAPSLGLAPKATVVLPPSINPDAPTYWYSRAFGYNAYGSTVPVGPLKFFLNNPGALTSLASDAGNFVTAGSFDGNGIWWGIRYGSNQLVKIDTSTGAITLQGTITGAQTITGMAYDPSTNTMYCCNYTGSASNVGTLNMTTYVFTPLAGTITGILIDMACSNAGQLYAVNISDDNLYSINKTTGNGTVVGPLGVNANYAQGMSWDRTVDSCYWASYTTLGELRRINVQTGASTLIGATNCEIDGFAIPGFAGPQIQHTPLPNTENLTGPYVVNAVITPPQGSTITYAKIFWSRNNPTITDSITMTNSGNNYTGNIPGNGAAATYRYYLKAIDNQGRVSTAPGGAPTNLYLFVAAPDTVKPVITHTPYTQIPKVTWPVTVNCVVTDNIGVDSVWVGWRKSFNGAYKRFNLAHGSGNNWSGTFNSTNPEVAPGDTIYYRIIARDASSQQNKDSTVLYNPVIINQTTACIGTGTISSNYPFTTYWMDGRTQILLLASEILANQGAAGNIIKVGFNVITRDPAPMNGFKVQMQHTTATTLTSFVSTGWTTCYSGTYTLAGTGWQYINLTTPFNWNGTSNLLIEICYNNSSYTSYSPVYATTATSMMVGQYTDLPSGDGCTQLTTPSVLTYRANTCLVINPATGVSNNTNGVPVEYKLSQNYPNPFNPVTKISFDIPKQGLVTLKIYDVLGREVRTLVNEVKNAGSYTVDFNAADLSSGVYFYKLEVNGFSDVKRMMLIK